MVALGHENTYNITVDEMLIFIKAVANGAKNSFIIGDMPFMSYSNLDKGLENAAKMIKAGANAIKLEGCNEHILTLIKKCVESGIPVLGHLGLTPQSLNAIPAASVPLSVEKALKLQEAGVFALVLELMPTESAEYITNNLKIPTIGIGSGNKCSGQIVVTDDILGKFTDFAPKFIKKYANLHDLVLNSIKEYSDDVKKGLFPSLSESFNLQEGEKEKLNALK